MENRPGLTGKFVRLFFDDMGKVLLKEGIIVSESISFVEIKTEKGVEAIPTSKVVRIEIIERGWSGVKW
jgi:hypothetical protein